MTAANLETTLAERKSRYGTFEGHAALAQQFKRTMHLGASWSALADDQKECLEMVMHKVARILNGDPNYVDSWHDILGYVKLVEQRLQGEQTPSVEIQDGPYCVLCESLADFRGHSGRTYCSNCCAHQGIDTSSMYTLGTL